MARPRSFGVTGCQHPAQASFLYPGVSPSLLCVLELRLLSGDTALAPCVSLGPRWPSPDPLGFLTCPQV